MLFKPFKYCVKYPAPYSAYIPSTCTTAKKGDVSWLYVTGAAKWGTYIMRFGSAIVFGLLMLFSLFSFIKTDDRIMQKVYFRFIAWMIPSSWILSFIILIYFIAASAKKTKALQDYVDTLATYNVGVTNFAAKYMGMALTYSAVVALVEWGAFMLREKTVKFYRWDEQSWWNYDPEDAPGNFPSQLGDSY